MEMFFDSPALETCMNMGESYGEICVGCGQCGRQPHEMELPAKARTDIDRLFEEEFS